MSDPLDSPVDSFRPNRAEIEASAADGSLVAAIQRLDQLEKIEAGGLLARAVGEEHYDPTQLSDALGRARNRVRLAYKQLVYVNGLFDK